MLSLIRHPRRVELPKNGTHKEDLELPALSLLLVVLWHFLLPDRCIPILIRSSVCQYHVQCPLLIRFSRAIGRHSGCIWIGGNTLQYAHCVNMRFQPKVYKQALAALSMFSGSRSRSRICEVLLKEKRKSVGVSHWKKCPLGLSYIVNREGVRSGPCI